MTTTEDDDLLPGRKKKRPTLLSPLRLLEVSLVDRGANPLANVVLHKRAEDPDREVPMTPFDTLVEKTREDEPSLSRCDAMELARKAYSIEFDRYQSEGAIVAEPIRKKAPPPDAVREFDNRVTDLVLKGMSRTAAMTKVAKDDPASLAKYQAA